MDSSSSQLVVAFPISTSAFGLRSDWFEALAPKLLRPSFLLIIMLLVISIGILALKRFENADFAKKLWNLPVLITITVFWPSLVIGLKELVDTFDTFLVVNVFGIPWRGFGFPEVGSVGNLMMWPTAGLARLLPNLAYWIIYAFYIILFFFYSVLGPLVLAKGVLFDEIETFLDLMKELVILLLWQTTLVILVAFIMPSIVSGNPFPAHPETNLYFLSIILGVMIFFIPALTRKFGAHIESAFVPLGFRWGGAMLGLGAIGSVGGMALSRAGMSLEGIEKIKPWGERILQAEEFKTRYGNRRDMRDLKEDRSRLEGKVHEYHDEDRSKNEVLSALSNEQGPDESEPRDTAPPSKGLIGLAKKAKIEMGDDDQPET